MKSTKEKTEGDKVCKSMVAKVARAYFHCPDTSQPVLQSRNVCCRMCMSHDFQINNNPAEN